MDSEAKQKLYEMHGTVSRLDEKFDKVMEKQGRLDNRINQNQEKISELERLKSRVMGGVALASAIVSTAVTLLATGKVP